METELGEWNLELEVSEWVCKLSRVRLFVTLWTVAHQAPVFVGFSRQKYWRGLPFPELEVDECKWHGHIYSRHLH